MKAPKDILFRLLFLMAVIFCLGLEVDTHYGLPMDHTEFSSGQNGEDNILLSDLDLLEDDHVSQNCECSCLIEQLVVIPTSNQLFLLEKFSFSSWQPPKHS